MPAYQDAGNAYQSAGSAYQDGAALVAVPDVVGQTQASGTTELEADAFVVAVATAYSSTVATGLIISQSPAAGSMQPSGATVTITVSLGPEGSSGGWFTFLNTYEHQQAKRRAEAKRRRELEEETERIEDATDREIAQLLRVQEAQDAKRQNLARLTELARQNADLEAARQYSERVAKAYQAVLEKGSIAAAERLEKELRRAKDEEEFLLLAIMLLTE